MSSPDHNAQVQYVDFAKKCTTYISELFSMKSITDKAELIESKQYIPPKDLDFIELTNLELF
jgi:hypothetical protein